MKAVMRGKLKSQMTYLKKTRHELYQTKIKELKNLE